MNKIKIIILLAAFFVENVVAQEVNENQMDQDIEVMEGILDQMLFQDKNTVLRKKQVSGNFIPDFGIIFKVSKPETYLFGQNVSPQTYSVIAGQNAQVLVSAKVSPENDVDSVIRADNDYFRETVGMFFINYGDLINQLQPEHRILVIYGPDATDYDFVESAYVRQQLKKERVETLETDFKITAQVNFGDILDYKRNKINEGQFRKNIRFSQKGSARSDQREFSILAGILEKIYGHHHGSIGKEGGIGFERIEGLGAIYEMKMHAWSSNAAKISGMAFNLIAPDGEGQNSDQTRVNVDDYKEKMEAYKKQQKESYVEFKTKLKQNLIKYGKTLKSLQNGEILMLVTTFPDCFSCEKPEKLNLSVKASVLKDYDLQKMTLDQAVAEIVEKEVKADNKW